MISSQPLYDLKSIPELKGFGNLDRSRDSFSSGVSMETRKELCSWGEGLILIGTKPKTLNANGGRG